MKRLFAVLALVTLFAGYGFSTAADYTIACGMGGDAVVNKVTQATSVTAQKSIDITVTPGYKATIMFVDDQAWKYRSTSATSTTDLPVAAAQSLTLTFTESTRIYELRSSADGTLCIVPLTVAKNQ